ncbi:MAG: DUF4249 domain-containing protein [Flavobacteriaceae bacterium]|nr:DUF4249 domain-containing protein [Bacteroidia bacterium]MBT8288552.1 DUF4249 domain-containing protein [Bacteroidia bacterium]NNF74816.1 DUF4249 domain-containing protein [Flavobacteriaceae bacterium]NNK72675.1 DUF4249 domain-containing protein [Flavobacteriaceae bacterium]
MIKKQYISFFILCIVLLSWSCEDVIEVQTPSEAPRLIVDALIRVDTTQTTNLVRVKVSETNNFFGTVPPADLQQITMSNLDNPGGDEQVLLEESPGSGIYSKLFPTDQLVNDRWFLQIDFEDEFYVANARFQPSVPFDSVVQGDQTLFNEDDTEIILSYTDFPDREDYYLFDFDNNNFFASEDTFYRGQSFSFSYFYDDNLQTGDELEISILGINEDFYNYMNLLIDQSNEAASPFVTPSVTVRGNIINATEIDNDSIFNNLNNSNNFALGYFAIAQEFKTTITIED